MFCVKKSLTFINTKLFIIYINLKVISKISCNLMFDIGSYFSKESRDKTSKLKTNIKLVDRLLLVEY